MAVIRIGAPGYVATRPLIFGLIHRPDPDVELIYREPSALGDALERGALDAALIPSIEFLRGVGGLHIDGPALVARRRTGSLLLMADKPIAQLQRIAVNEFSRTSVAALRILLDKLQHVTPDLCVLKDTPANWQESFDALLLTSDQGLAYLARPEADGRRVVDLGEMWHEVFPPPFVMALWAYNDERLGDRLKKLLIDSRDAGVSSLSLLADGIARTTPYDGKFLYDYFTTRWCYDMGGAAESGLRILEESALEYHLIPYRRAEKFVLR